jgi:hypothetical protein
LPASQPVPSREDAVEIAEVFRQPFFAKFFAALRRFRLLVFVVPAAGDGMMGVVHLGHQIGEGQLQLMHPEAAGIGFGREPMPLAEEQENVSRLRDGELAGFQERRREGRSVGLRLHLRHHLLVAAFGERDVAIRRARVFQRQPHEFPAPRNARPVPKFVGDPAHCGGGLAIRYG